jgi:Tol biopolymer transport system component
MNQTRKKVVLLVAFLAVGSIPVFGKPFAEGPYLGQTPPGSTARVFAPGLISDTQPQQWESHGTFSTDGNTFCYLRCPIRHSPRVGGVFITENTNQGWTAPKLIESIGEYSAWAPCLSPDANSIYFARGFPESKRDLYRCDRTPHGWAVPQVLGSPLSSPSNEISCSIAANNNIYFGSIRKGGKFGGISIIFAAPFVDNTWPRVTYISMNNQQVGRPADPGIAPDESFMVFTAINLPGGYGHRDIYLTLRLPDGTWSKPRNLGPKINSTYIDQSPRISPDKKYLFFTRSTGWDPRKHSADIYWVELKEYLPESYR